MDTLLASLRELIGRDDGVNRNTMAECLKWERPHFTPLSHIKTQIKLKSLV